MALSLEQKDIQSRKQKRSLQSPRSIWRLTFESIIFKVYSNQSLKPPLSLFWDHTAPLPQPPQLSVPLYISICYKEFLRRMWGGEKGWNQHPYIFERKTHKKIKETCNKKSSHSLLIEKKKSSYSCYKCWHCPHEIL